MSRASTASLNILALIGVLAAGCTKHHHDAAQPSSQPLRYTGTGYEIAGTYDPSGGRMYVGEITTTSGFFVPGDYAMVDQTMECLCAIDGATHKLTLDTDPSGSGNLFDLDANPDARDYEGDTTYTESASGSPMEGWDIALHWKVYSTGDRVQADVIGTATMSGSATKTGALHLIFYNPWRPGTTPAYHGFYDGWVANSSDWRYVNSCDNWYFDNGDDTITLAHVQYVVATTDAISPFCYQDGTRVAGGDFAYTAFGDRFFEKFTVTLDHTNDPLSATTWMHDYSDLRVFAGTNQTLVNERLGSAMTTHGSDFYDLTPTAVTGDILGSYFTVGVTAPACFERRQGQDVGHFMELHLPLSGVGLDTDPQGYPGWDYAATWYFQTYDRHDPSTNGGNIILRLRVVQDTTTFELTSGHLDLYHVDASGGRTGPWETMDFQLH